jgi:hypothetical protein
MNARQTAIENMTRAFEQWEIDFRANPDGYMDAAAVKASNPAHLAELRALYFADLLERVRTAKGGA